jgi:hypothetical protein
MNKKGVSKKNLGEGKPDWLSECVGCANIPTKISLRVPAEGWRQLGEGKTVGPTMKMKLAELWLAYQDLPPHTRTTSQGRKVVTFTGKKNGLRGGFLSNMTSPHVAKLHRQFKFD